MHNLTRLLVGATALVLGVAANPTAANGSDVVTRPKTTQKARVTQRTARPTQRTIRPTPLTIRPTQQTPKRQQSTPTRRNSPIETTRLTVSQPSKPTPTTLTTTIPVGPSATPTTPAPPSPSKFKLVTKSPYSVRRGQQFQIGIEVVRESSFTGQVELQIAYSNLRGISYSFAPNPTSASTNLYFTVPANYQPGTYGVTVSGLAVDSRSNIPATLDVQIAVESGCSTGGSSATSIDFTNTTTGIVDIFWIDQNCAEKFYFRLQPGTSARQGTYVGHEWVVRDSAGKELVRAGGVPGEQKVRIAPR